MRPEEMTVPRPPAFDAFVERRTRGQRRRLARRRALLPARAVLAVGRRLRARMR